MHRSPPRWRKRSSSLRSPTPLLVKRPRKWKNSKEKFDQHQCVTPSPSRESGGCRAPLLTREHPNTKKGEKILVPVHFSPVKPRLRGGHSGWEDGPSA